MPTPHAWPESSSPRGSARKRRRLGRPALLESVLAVWAIAKTGAAYLPVDPNYPADRIAHMLDRLRRDHRPHRRGQSPTDCPAPLRWLLLDEPTSQARIAAVRDPVRDRHRRGSARSRRAPRLRHLHLRLHRHAQGRRRSPTPAWPASARTQTRHYALRPRPPHPALCLAQLRRVGARNCCWRSRHGATLVIAPPDVYGGDELADLLRAERVTPRVITPAALAASTRQSTARSRSACRSGGEAIRPPNCAGRYAGSPARSAFLNGYGPTEATIVATNIGDALTGRPRHHRRPDPRHACVCPRRPAAAGAGGRRRRAVPGGRPAGPRLPWPRRPHRRPLRRRPVRADPASACTAPATSSRWTADGDAGVPGPHRLPGEDPRLPHRARRDRRRRSLRCGRDRPVRGRRPLRRPRRRPAGRLRGRRRPDEHRPRCRAPPTSVVARCCPRYMVPPRSSILDALPLNAVRQARPQGAARAGVRGRGVPRARHPGRARSSPASSPRCSAPTPRRRRRRLLRPRRQLAARHPGRRPARRGARHPASRCALLFEAPTVAALAAARRDRRRCGDRPALAARPAARRTSRCRSPSSACGSSTVRHPSSAAYNIPSRSACTGDSTSTALRAGRRRRGRPARDPAHRLPGDRPTVRHQVILPTAQVGAASCTDDRGRPRTDRIAAVMRNSRRRRSMSPPRCRCAVALFRARRAPIEHVLALVVHHIAADGSSLGPLARDLMTAYAARVAGRARPAGRRCPCSTPTTRSGSATLLGAEDDPDSLAAKQLAYWREALAGPARPARPAHRPAASRGRSRSRAARTDFEIDADTARARCSTWPARDSATLFMVVHAALAVLLARLSGTDDIAIGTPSPAVVSARSTT